MDESIRLRMSRLLGCLTALVFALAAPAAYAQVAGRTATTSGVTATGEAQYQVPLVLPPGTNGMTPQLALSYGSHTGEGIAGQGWGLAGLSVVHRCPKTLAQDGVAREVKLDLQDRFCLNGNQLKLTGGTYGVAGSTYQTEMEQFARVTAYGAAGNGPAYFIAEYKNGLIYEFGNTTNSRIESKGVAHVRTWAVNKIRDRNQNEILFNYTEDTVNGSYRINTIQYAGNPNQALAPRYTVQFTYETVPVGDNFAWYFAGGLIKYVTRLDKVEVFYYTRPAQPIRSYDLTYEEFLSSAHHSRLASIIECGTTPSNSYLQCYAPLQLTYKSNSAGIDYLNAGAVLANVPAWSDALPIDVNGDGRTDLVYSSNTTAGSGTWMVMFANSSGAFNAPTNTGITNNAYTQAIPIDYNSDGLQDVLVPYSGGTWWVMLGTANGFAVPSNTGAPVSSTAGNAAALDVNGDGLDDLVWAQINVGGNDSVLARLRVWGGAFAATTTELLAPLGAGTSIVGPVWGRNRYRSHLLQPDFNGDGNKDFLVTILSPSGTYTWEAVLSGGAGVFAIGSGGGTMQFMAPFDLNGDGLSDIFYTGGNNGFAYRLSDGKGFRPHSTATVYPWDDNRTAVVVDYEGDGYDDVLVPITVLGQKKWHIIRSDGEQLLTAYDIGRTTTAQFAYAAEYTGEGIADGLIVEPNGDVKGLVSGTHPPDVLKTVTDAYGNVLTFNDTTLAKGSYTRGSTATYPQRDYQGPYSIVANTVQPNGIGGTYTTTYTYTGARFDLQGRGFLGFSSRTVTDSRSNLIATDTFLQGYPYTGLVSQHDVQQPGGSPTISQTATTYQTLTLGTGYEQRKFPYASSSTEKHWEVGGLQNGNQIDEVVTTTLVDTYGTPYDVTTTRTEKTTANGVQPSATYTQRTLWPTANLVNNTTNWCLGRPGKVQQIQSHSQYSGTSITRTTDFTWDTPLCRVTQAVVESASTTKKVTTDLGYDGFGNVNSTTVTGRNANGTAMTARTTTTNWGTTGQFPTTITNPLGQITQKGWELFNGWQTSETDPNGLVTSWVYDGVGHRTRENRPDGSMVLTNYELCAWGTGTGLTNGEACSAAQYTSYLDVADTRGNKRTVQYFDRLDRPVLSSVYMQSAGNVFSYTTTEYDNKGNVSRDSAPCWWGSCTQYWTTYTSDLVGRRTQASRPISQSDPTLQTTTTYYEGLTSRVVDAEGKESTKIANVVGLPARSTDHAGYYQTFDYDAFGSLKRVQDSLANTLFSATYSYSADALRTQTVDMDLGTWNYTLNSLSEITSYTDAKAQTFTYTYDVLSRPLTRVETEGTTTWTWGNSAVSFNIGQLQSVSGPGGYSESFVYDNKSRVSQKNIVADATTCGFHAGRPVIPAHAGLAFHAMPGRG